MKDVESVAFSPDGKILASGSWDGKIHLWETATGKHIKELHGHIGNVSKVAFSSHLIGFFERNTHARLYDLSLAEPYYGEN